MTKKGISVTLLLPATGRLLIDMPWTWPVPVAVAIFRTLKSPTIPFSSQYTIRMFQTLQPKNSTPTSGTAFASTRAATAQIDEPTRYQARSRSIRVLAADVERFGVRLTDRDPGASPFRVGGDEVLVVDYQLRLEVAARIAVREFVHPR